jgi:sugar phosphate isomerase/epimerase
MTAGPYATAYDTYRHAGWHGVIPLPPRKKAWPPGGYTGETGAWPSAADCITWADGDEGAGNIALRLPHGVLGVDVDDYGDKHGAQTVAQVEARWGALPATWLTSSRDGASGIRLFRVPEGLAFPGELGPSVELIQHRYRYAVVWPSIHPEGRTYRWVGPDGNECDVPDPDQLPLLPESWVLGLTGGHEHEDTPRNDWGDTQVQRWIIDRPRAAEQPCDRMRRAVDGALLALHTGASAHDTILSGVIRVVRLADEGHGGAVAALGQLHNTFMATVTAPARTGHTRTFGEAEAEWRRGLTGAVNKVTAAPTGVDTCDCDGRLTNAIVAAAGPPLAAPASQPAGTPSSPADPGAEAVRDAFIESQVEYEAQKLRIREEAKRRVRRERTAAQQPPSFVTLDEFLAVEDDPQRYRVEQLWPVGGRVMLAAQFKSGKTTLVGNLVRSLVDGAPFLGRFLTHRPDGRVGLVDNELDARMLRSWYREQGIVNTGQVTVLPLRGAVSTFDVLDTDGRAQWAQALRDAAVQILIVDCLAPFLDALGLSEDKEAGQFLVALDELAKEAGVEEVVLVHHMGHNGERARGASRLRDWPDVEWKLTREKAEEGEDNPNARRYFAAYGRDVDISESALDYDKASRALTLTGGSRKEAASAETAEAVVAYLADNPGSPKIQVEMALTAGHGRNKIRTAIDMLVRDGRVTVAYGPNRSSLLSLTAMSIAEAYNRRSHPVDNRFAGSPLGAANRPTTGQEPISPSVTENGASIESLEVNRFATTLDAGGEPNPQVTEPVRQFATSSPPVRRDGGDSSPPGSPYGRDPGSGELAESATRPRNQTNKKIMTEHGLVDARTGELIPERTQS